MIAATIALCATAANLNAQGAGNQPKIQLMEPVYDFGNVLSGPSVKHTFKVKNAGASDLVISRVQTSCGCTAAAPSKKLLKPGEEADIAVTFDTRFEKGHSERVITVFSNDPQNPEAQITMKGDLKIEVEAKPDDLYFGKMKLGTEQTRQVTLTYVGKSKDFKIEKISNSNPHIKVAQEALKDGKPGAILTVSVEKGMPVGAFDDSIEIITNQQPIQVRVAGHMTGPITLAPQQLSFGIVPHGQGASRIVRLTSSGSRAVQITGISSSTPSVGTKIDPVTPGKEYKITVELRKGTPDGQLRGQLSIKTDDPQEPLLTVPFYGIVGVFQG